MTPARRRDDAPDRPFRLFRYFFLASFVGITAVMLGLFYFLQRNTVDTVVELGGQANAMLARVIANSVWHDHHDVLELLDRERMADFGKSPLYQELDHEIRQVVRGLPVVKVKIYNLAGLTVYSSDLRQVGEDKSSNPGFVSARAGGLTSAITRRDRFDAFDGEIADRDLIFSYVPFSTASSGRPEAVVEVYSDVTESLRSELAATWRIGIGLWLALTALFVFLLVVVRKADTIIREQREGLRASQKKVSHMAYHDALTGLPNRTSFAEHLDEAVAAVPQAQDLMALMFIDLDHFKAVNDTLGHAAGDELLQQVSRRISDALREGDLLFRVGGDEFTAIARSLLTKDDAGLLAQRIQLAVAPEFLLSGQPARVGATIGIAFCPADASSADDLIKRADAAMYAAKARGRGSFAFSS